jgi:hypothetical protein
MSEAFFFCAVSVFCEEGAINAMIISNESNKLEKAADDVTDQHQESPAAEGEFKVTVRKLEMPVRPRGVLAE